MAEERQLRLRNSEPKLHFVRAHVSSVLAHEDRIAAEREHHAGAKAVPADGCQRGNWVCHDTREQGHHLGIERLPRPTQCILLVSALRSHPGQVEPVGEKLGIIRAEGQRRRTLSVHSSACGFNVVERRRDLAHKCGVPAVLAVGEVNHEHIVAVALLRSPSAVRGGGSTASARPGGPAAVTSHHEQAATHSGGMREPRPGLYS